MPGAKFILRLIIGLLLLPVYGISQDIRISVDAEPDSMKIGVPFRVRVTVSHLAEIPVVFPDTSTQTYPFEIFAVEPEDASTKDSITTDARTYLLQSFEVDPVQMVRIPIGMVAGKDTLWITSDPDSVRLTEMISELPEKPQPWRHQGYVDLDDRIDPFELTVFIVALASALTLVGFAIRKPVLRAIYRWKCKREYQSFRKEFSRISAAGLPASEYYHLCGLLVRRYLESRVHEFLPSFTTPEFSSWMLRHEEILPDHREFLNRLMTQGDLGQYAGVEPSGMETSQLVAWIDRILLAELEYRLEHLPV